MSDRPNEQQITTATILFTDLGDSTALRAGR